MAAEPSFHAAILEWAIKYPRHGWAVFPLKWPYKVPATDNGFYDASTDIDKIRAEFEHPRLRYNLGIRTGIESGIMVVDVDNRHGGEQSLAVWESTYGALPPTVISATGGGGRHYVFRHPGGRVGNRTGVKPGIDVRGDGGYIVAPPSARPGGKRYAWVPGHAPGEIELADAPDWLLDQILRRTATEDTAGAGEPRPQEPRGAASEDESLLCRARKYVERVPPSQEGSRNSDAFRLAGHLRQFCDANGRHLDEGVIFELMREWNARSSPPLSEHELLTCLRNAGKNGTPPPPKPPKGDAGKTSEGFGGASQGANEKNWRDPQPVVHELPPVKPLTDSYIPEAFRAWLRDIADRMQCPLDFMGAALLVGIAAIVGRRIGIRPKRHDDWTVVPNVWGGVIGRPAIMKSPAVLEVMKGLRRLELEARKRFQAEMQKYREARALHDAKQKQAKKDLSKALEAGEDTTELVKAAAADGPTPPVRGRLVLNDATVEKLGEILNENPNGVLQLRDELIGLLRGLDKEGQEPARAFYLEAWDGKGTFVYDRIARGTIDIDSVTVSIFGCIQPGPLSHYLAGAMAGGEEDDGLIQRFQILVWPDVSRDWINVDRWPDTEAKQNAYAVFKRLSELTAEAVEAKCDKFDPEGIPYLHFSAEAQKVFDAWRDKLERRIRADDEHPAFESHLGKYRSLFPSIALLWHVADGQRGPVCVEYAHLAEAWCEYLESHARRIYSLVIRADAAAAKTLSKKILSHTLKSPFTLRDVYKNDWAGLTSREMVKNAVDILIDLDWLVERAEKGAVGAPKTVYVINSKLFAKEAPSEGPSKTSTSDGADGWEEV